MDEIPAWALEKAREAVAKQRKHEGIAQVVARTLVAERERAAGIAEAFTTSEHIAHDMGSGIFPKQSEIREAIAAAIRKAE